MRQRDFLKSNFPLAFRWHDGHVMLDWFEDMGVARLGGQFVIEVTPMRWSMYQKAPVVSRHYGEGWGGLVVRIVEHGVGEIAKEGFKFERYCAQRGPGAIVRAGGAAADELRKLHETDVGQQLMVIVESDALPESVEVPTTRQSRSTTSSIPSKTT